MGRTPTFLASSTFESTEDHGAVSPYMLRDGVGFVNRHLGDAFKAIADHHLRGS